MIYYSTYLYNIIYLIIYIKGTYWQNFRYFASDTTLRFTYFAFRKNNMIYYNTYLTHMENEKRRVIWWILFYLFHAYFLEICNTNNMLSKSFTPIEIEIRIQKRKCKYNIQHLYWNLLTYITETVYYICITYERCISRTCSRHRQE